MSQNNSIFFIKAIFSLFVEWTPSSEKGRLIGLASAGSWIGDVIGLPLGGYLCVHGFDGGWPSIFYLFGIAGLIWSVAFLLLTAETPSKHRFISEGERDYIIQTSEKKSETMDESSKTPWLEIAKSKSVIAIIFSHFACNWANYLFLTQLPSYMNDILRFDIKSVSIRQTK